MMRRVVKCMLIRSLVMTCLLSLVIASSYAADSHNREKLDSVITMLNNMPNDSTRLRQAYISIQENLNQYWTLDLIKYAQAQAEQQNHKIWKFAFMGSKVRWAHRFHDWERMELFLKDQREKAIKENERGNYLSQIGQSAIVMAQMGRFEQSWRYIQQMEKDIDNAGDETYKRYEIYKYLVKAEYYKYCGEESKRLSLLLEALNKNMRTNPIQRVSLHIELIDVFGEKKEYEKALAHADSVLYIYEGYSPERKLLPQSRGSISEANLQKVEIYFKKGDFPMMKKSLKIAEEYMNTTDLKNEGNVYFWWSKYYFGIKDYARSIEYLDKAVQIYHEHSSEESAIVTELDKVGILREMGRYEEALELNTTKLLALDSIRQVMISEQQTYLDELSNILSQRERSEKMQAWQSYLMVIIAIVLTVIVLAILVYVIHVRKELKHNYRITKEKLKEAKDADKEKERFLRNITRLINAPLQHVVKDAKRLSDDTTMSQEEQSVLVTTNKQHVRHLLDLVNNVLDLSRLEAGMMKYSARSTDIVRLIMRFISDYNKRNMSTPIRNVCFVESYTMEIDSERLSKIIENLFSLPFNYKGSIPAHRSINIEEGESNSLVITITGSLFADERKLEEMERMTNRINKFVLGDFNSSYEITSDSEIVITLNSKQ